MTIAMTNRNYNRLCVQFWEHMMLLEHYLKGHGVEYALLKSSLKPQEKSMELAKWVAAFCCRSNCMYCFRGTVQPQAAGEQHAGGQVSAAVLVLFGWCVPVAACGWQALGLQ